MPRPLTLSVLGVITVVAGAAIAGWISSRPEPVPRVVSGAVAEPPPSTPPSSSAPTTSPPGSALASRGVAPTAASAPTGSLVVTVRSEDDRPVVGTSVVVTGEGEPLRGRTGVDGTLRFDRVPAGDDVDVRAEAEGFTPREDDVRVDEGREAAVSLELEAGLPFDGTVLDDLTGRPVRGARVVVRSNAFGDAAWSLCATTQSGDDGRFHVPGFPLAGHHGAIETEAEGYAAGSTRFELKAGHIVPAEVVVRLAPGGRVTGVVRDPDGRPVADAAVYVFPAWAEPLREHFDWGFSSTQGQVSARSTVSDAQGRYVVSGLRLDEEHAAAAKRDGFAMSAVADGLRLRTDAREATVDLTLRAFASIVVRVVDPKAHAVVDVESVTLGGSFSPAAKPGPTEGSFRFDGLEPRTHWVHVRSRAFLPKSASVVAAPGAVAELVVRLDAGETISGVTVDERGEPLAGVDVGAGPADENEKRLGSLRRGHLRDGRWARSDVAGRFEIAGLEAKPHLLLARASSDPDSVKSLRPERVTPPASGLRLVVVRHGSAVILLKTPDGKPYAGEAMLWWGKDGALWSQDTAETADGTFVVTGIEAGEWEVGVRVFGFGLVVRPVHGALGQRVDLGDSTLDPGITVKGRVVGPDGAPVSDARVFVPSRRLVSVTTEEDGSFSLAHQPVGTLRVAVNAEGFPTIGRAIDVAAGMAPVEIRLPRGAFVKLLARGKDAVPVVATFLATRVGSDEEPVFETTGDDGRAEWRLVAGRWRIARRVWNGDERRDTPLEEWTLEDGETRTVELIVPAR